LGKELSSENLTFHRKSSALIILEQNVFVAELHFEDLVFGEKVIDDLLLLLIDPAGQNHKQPLPGSQGRVPRNLILGDIDGFP